MIISTLQKLCMLLSMVTGVLACGYYVLFDIFSASGEVRSSPEVWHLIWYIGDESRVLLTYQYNNLLEVVGGQTDISYCQTKKMKKMNLKQ